MYVIVMGHVIAVEGFELKSHTQSVLVLLHQQPIGPQVLYLHHRDTQITLVMKLLA